MNKNSLPVIAILASGNGSTAEAFIHATHDGTVNAQVALMICNNPPHKAGIYDRIKRLNKQCGLNIKAINISGATHPDGPGQKGEQTLEESKQILREVKKAGCTLIILMGYMKRVRGSLLEVYGWHSSMTSLTQARMLNTHAGPLPETTGSFGIHLQELVLSKRLGYSAHTVHIVSADYDTGPIIAQTRVPVISGDTPEKLFKRVQDVEKAQLPLIINSFLTHK